MAQRRRGHRGGDRGPAENLADVLWPGRSALGRTMRLVSGQGVEVIGVAPNGFFSGYRREPRPGFVFWSMQQEPPTPGEATFYVRYAGSIDGVVPVIGRAIHEVDARVPIVYVRTMDTQLESLTWLVRALTMLLTLFASGSLVIAALGQYAVMVFTMRRRTRDCGVRMALGASSRQILASVLREGLRLTAVGLAIGFALESDHRQQRAKSALRHHADGRGDLSRCVQPAHARVPRRLLCARSPRGSNRSDASIAAGVTNQLTVS